MKIGEIKKEKKFAWLPTTLENNKIKWLSFYTEEYVYQEYEECYSLPFGLPWNRGRIRTTEGSSFRKYGRFFFFNEVGWKLKRKY